MYQEAISIQESENLSKAKSGRQLSEREKEVLLLIAYENTNEEIAKKLFLAKGTIATYRNNLLTKLGVKNTAGMVRKAFEVSILKLNSVGKIEVNNI